MRLDKDFYKVWKQVIYKGDNLLKSTHDGAPFSYCLFVCRDILISLEHYNEVQSNAAGDWLSLLSKQVKCIECHK